MTTEGGPGILEALGRVAMGLGPVMKDRVDAGRGGSYQAFSVDTVYAHLRPLFAEHGISVSPRPPKVKYAERPRQGGGVQIDARLTGTWRLYALDGSWLPVSFAAEARDTGDKATIQAAQQAFKYALVQAFLISAGDPSAETPPEDAQPAKPKPKRRKPEDWEIAAKQELVMLFGGREFEEEAAKAWPELLTIADVAEVRTKKAYEKVSRVAVETYGVAKDAVEQAAEQTDPNDETGAS